MAAKKTGLIALVLIVVAAAAGAGGWWWMNREGGPGSGGEANNSVDQPLTAELPASPYATPTPTQEATPAAAEQFTLAAVIEDPNGFTNVHSGPSTVAPIVARVSAGESFSTYEQGDDWWKVRTAGGLIGYMPRRRIRVQGNAPPVPGVTPPVTTAMPGAANVPGQAMTTNATPAAETPKAAPRPRPPRPRSRINRANSANMRAFCQNAGRGTPQCRAFTRELRGR